MSRSASGMSSPDEFVVHSRTTIYRPTANFITIDILKVSFQHKLCVLKSFKTAHYG